MTDTNAQSQNDSWLNRTGWVFILLFAIIIAGTTISINWFQIGINTQLVENWNDILLKYLFIIVICERTAAAIMDINFQKSLTELRKKVNNWQTKIDLKLKILEPIKDEETGKMTRQEITKNDLNQVDNLINEKLFAELKLEKVQNERRKVNMRFLLFIGVFLAIAGLSVMNDLVIFPDAWGKGEFVIQRWIMKFMDILLTGALIGGGSTGFYEIFSTIQSFLDKTKTQNEAKS